MMFLFVAVLSLAEGLTLPSTLTRLSNGRRHSVTVHPTVAARTCRRNGPLNVMPDSTTDIDPINATTTSFAIVDPINAADVSIDWVDATEVAAHVEGTSLEEDECPIEITSYNSDCPVEVAMKRPIIDYLPKEVIEIEEEVMVIKSAQQQQQETSTKEAEIVAPHSVVEYVTTDHPSISKIIKFSLPAIGVWLCSPVLSMIDTASVGLLAGTAQQAALNPAVSETDYGALLVADRKSVV